MELENVFHGPVNHGRSATESALPGYDPHVTVCENELLQQSVFKRLARPARVPLLVNVHQHAVRVVMGGAKLASGRLADCGVIRGEEEVAAVPNVTRDEAPHVTFNSNTVISNFPLETTCSCQRYVCTRHYSDAR